MICNDLNGKQNDMRFCNVTITDAKTVASRE